MVDTEEVYSVRYGNQSKKRFASVMLSACIYSVHVLGVRPICQHNFGNNRMLEDPRIMLE